MNIINPAYAALLTPPLFRNYHDSSQPFSFRNIIHTHPIISFQTNRKHHVCTVAIDNFSLINFLPNSVYNNHLVGLTDLQPANCKFPIERNRVDDDLLPRKIYIGNAGQRGAAYLNAIDAGF